METYFLSWKKDAKNKLARLGKLNTIDLSLPRVVLSMAEKKICWKSRRK